MMYNIRVRSLIINDILPSNYGVIIISLKVKGWIRDPDGLRGDECHHTHVAYEYTYGGRSRKFYINVSPMASHFFFIEETEVNLAFRYLKCVEKKDRSKVIPYIQAESEIWI